MCHSCIPCEKHLLPRSMPHTDVQQEPLTPTAEYLQHEAAEAARAGELWMRIAQFEASHSVSLKARPSTAFPLFVHVRAQATRGCSGRCSLRSRPKWADCTGRLGSDPSKGSALCDGHGMRKVTGFRP